MKAEDEGDTNMYKFEDPNGNNFFIKASQLKWAPPST